MFKYHKPNLILGLIFIIAFAVIECVSASHLACTSAPVLTATVTTGEAVPDPADIENVGKIIIEIIIGIIALIKIFKKRK